MPRKLVKNELCELGIAVGLIIFFIFKAISNPYKSLSTCGTFSLVYFSFQFQWAG